MTSATVTPIPTPVSTATWQIDPTHTSVDFAVRHLMLATVRGRFGSVSGTVQGVEGNSPSPQVEISIDAASIDTRQAQRDQHLRSPDFLDTANFPTITFRATRARGPVIASFTLTGDLTIRGITREITFKVEHQGQTLDPWGNQRAGFSAIGSLNRRDFGLTWNQVLEAGGLAVGDEVKFTIDVELTRQAA